MTKFLERSEVIKLRLQGKSYSEIKQIVNVSKSSLSLWLRNVQLTEKQISGLKEKKIRSVERFIKSMKIKRQIRLETYLNNQKHKWLPLSEREEFIAGLFLYSGEGNKVSSNSISISNTDPSVIKFSYYWMQNCLLIPREKIFLKLHLYDDMNIEEETNFWSKEIGIDKKQFKRPYIKKSSRIDIDQKGYGHGTCGVWAFKTEIKENILM
ncbi:MAG: hypothetical protein UR20_C0020G0006, partial [Candidatus Woesebacteria bacterium GW2011_GWE2_31_6]